NYREITSLRHISFLGDTVALGVGISNPWMLVGQVSLLLLVIFTLDATLTALAQAVLVLWQIVDMPLTESFFFLGIVVAMAYEMSRETLRAAQLSEELRESEVRMTLAAEAAGFGVWMWTTASSRIWGSEKWLRLFGFAPGEAVTFEKVIQRVHPDDRERMESAVRRAMKDQA